MVTTEVLRLLAATSVLAFAAVCDLRWRRAPDASWWILGGLGVALLAWDLTQDPTLLDTYMPHLVVAGLILVMAVAGYLTGLVTGGADAKALASLAVLMPLPALALALPMESGFPLVLTVLLNGLLVALVVPVALVVSNLARGRVDGWRTLLGFPVSVEALDYRVMWPLDWVDEEGTVHRHHTPGGVPIDGSEPSDYRAHGIETVWVTPKVPFLVPLWAGLVVTILVGDPVAAGFEAILG